MKKNFILLLALVTCASTMFANGSKVGDLFYLFYDNPKIAEVTYQYHNSSENYRYLTTVSIPDSIIYQTVKYEVRIIAWEAFSRCAGLTSVTFSNSLQSIGPQAFYDCSGLTSITIPPSVKGIGSKAFSGCTSLTSVHISDIASWCSINFVDYFANPVYKAENLYLNGELLTNLVIPDSVTSILDYAFVGCRNLTSIEIPNSVTSIKKCAFHKCDGFTSIVIPNSVVSIGDKAFYHCSKLKSVTIGNNITSIGDEVFGYVSVNEIHFVGNIDDWYAKTWSPILISSAYDLYIGEDKVTDLVIADGTITINDAFRGCTSLKSITIPESFKILEENAFSGCTSINAITCYSQRPPTVQEGALDGLAYSTIIYVPADYLETYKLHDVWGLFDVRPLETIEDLNEIEGDNAKSINKFIHNGQIFILHGDKTYTLQGQEVN